jgi:O-methyltransferase
MSLRTMYRRLIPVELQPPTNLPRRLLAKLGYFRLRTWLAAHGTPVPDSHLYQPLYSPWEGEAAFDGLYRTVKPHTLVSRDRCFVLWKTLQQAAHLPGEFIECGVFRGGTALLEAATLQEQNQARPLHLFDSFAGMPTTTAGVDSFQPREFRSTSAEAVGRLLSPYPFVLLHVGFIPDTFAGLQTESIAWAHVDVDLYKSVCDCIDYIYPRLVPGGFMIFDDYGFPSCASARRAVDEAFTLLPEMPLCLPTGQCLVVKLGTPANSGGAR